MTSAFGIGLGGFIPNPNELQVVPGFTKWHRCEVCDKIWSCGTSECGEPYVYGICGSRKCGNKKARLKSRGDKKYRYRYSQSFGGFVRELRKK